MKLQKAYPEPYRLSFHKRVPLSCGLFTLGNLAASAISSPRELWWQLSPVISHCQMPFPHFFTSPRQPLANAQHTFPLTSLPLRHHCLLSLTAHIDAQTSTPSHYLFLRLTQGTSSYPTACSALAHEGKACILYSDTSSEPESQSRWQRTPAPLPLPWANRKSREPKFWYPNPIPEWSGVAIRLLYPSPGVCFFLFLTFFSVYVCAV